LARFDDLQLSPTQFALHFETNHDIEARRLGAALIALDNEVRRFNELGPQARLTVRHVRAASPAILVLDVLEVMSHLAGVGSFVGFVMMQVRTSRRSALSRRLAEVMEDDGVVELTAMYRNVVGGELMRISVNREEVPAVRDLRAERAPRQIPDSISANIIAATDTAALFEPRPDESSSPVRLSTASLDDPGLDPSRTDEDPRAHEVALIGRFESDGGDRTKFVTLQGEELDVNASPELDSHIEYGEMCMIRGVLRRKRYRKDRPLFWIHEIIEATNRKLTSER
jgi:hypothetical protein